MTVKRTAALIQPVAADFPPKIWESHTAHFEARWDGRGLVLAVRGEIDAANAADLTEAARDGVAHCQWLVLDLTEVEFMGTAGFAALHGIDTVIDGVSWALVPSAAVTRLLRICDADGVLPSQRSMAEALAYVRDTRVLRLLG
ncbi:STAS domain-containing protein [Mycolicibacillus trivialis]